MGFRFLYPLLDRAGGLDSLIWLLRDEFTVADPAPITSPRTCSHEGTLVITDTNNYASISGGMVVTSDCTAANDPRFFSSSTFTRVAGLASFIDWQANANSRIFGYGFDILNVSISRDGLGLNNQAIVVYDNNVAYSLADTYTDATSYLLGIVIRGEGHFTLIKGGSEYPEWTLLFVNNVYDGTPLYCGVGLRNATGDQHQIDYLRVAQLPAPWNVNAGLPTDEIASPVLHNTFTHEADCIIEFDLDTLTTTTGMDLHFRKQDETNHWFIRVTAAGNIYLYEDVSGNTLRATALGVLSGGEHIVIVANDETITLYYDDTQAWSYSSAVNFKTKTAGEVDSLGDGAISDLVTYHANGAKGLATDSLMGTHIVASDTFTHEADCLIEFTVDTLPSSGSVLVHFRIQDSNNYWILRIISTGDLVLREYVAGSPTSRATAAGALSGGERIVIVADDETITGYYDNTQAWSYSSAATFKTETDGEVNSLGTGGAISDLITWPRTLSPAGQAKSILDQYGADYT